MCSCVFTRARKIGLKRRTETGHTPCGLYISRARARYAMASGAQACRLGAPPWGTWYRRQADAMQQLDSRPGHVIVAWALGDGKRGYVYGLFESMALFYKNLCKTPPAKRVGFEIIRKNTPCLLYLDVEWVGEADPEHAGIRRLCQRLREHCREKYGWDALRLYVTCGSREHNTGYKNSYHVHANVRFDNNHDGGMKGFVTGFVRERLGGDEWKWVRESGEPEHWVDLRVYTKNRPLRLPGNCKPGQTPHVRISGDPADEADPFRSDYDFEDPESWQRCIVLSATAGDDVYVCPRRAAPAQADGTPNARKRKREAAAGDTPPDRAAAPSENAASELPECVREALLGAGSSCTREPVKHFPACLQTQISHNFVSREDIVELRVSRPALCAPRYFRREREVHAHSSNGCLVLVVRQRKPELVELLGEVQVYIKCFCEKEPTAAFGRLGVEDKRLLELPRYDAPNARAEYVRYVVETQYGIDGVLDAAARNHVYKAYRLTSMARKAKMRNPMQEVAWQHVFACDGGWRAWPLPAREPRDFFKPRAV